MNPGRRSTRVARHVLASLCTAAALVACGGGTSQFEPFEPEQYVAFGDEGSLVRSDGRRYTVNPLTTAGAIDCKSEPLWTQAVANQYGFVFQECNPDGATTFKARMQAQLGAKADDLKTQIDTQLATGGFAAKSLATVMLGANDVLELYAQYPTRSEDSITEELRARGVRLAEQVNRLVALGVRVIVVTAPDVGLSPYALAEKANNTDTDRSALMSRLVAAFNGRVRVNILNDGRFVGLVLADELVQSMSKFPSAYSLTDVTSAVCTVALPACTTGTLVASGTSSGWLWADSTRMAYGAQLRIGSQAVSRAVGNPF